jgi:CheY-like chemotaxis protein
MTEVLVVDDNEDIAECVELVLEGLGYRVRRAADGAAGLSALNERLPDVVILDIDMPVLGGPAMARRMLIEDCGRERIPIVLSSASMDLQEIAASLGTPYWLAKPSSVADLVRLVARAAEERTAPSPPIPAGDPPCSLR